MRALLSEYRDVQQRLSLDDRLRHARRAYDDALGAPRRAEDASRALDYALRSVTDRPTRTRQQLILEWETQGIEVALSTAGRIGGEVRARLSALHDARDAIPSATQLRALRDAVDQLDRSGVDGHARTRLATLRARIHGLRLQPAQERRLDDTDRKLLHEIRGARHRGLGR